MAHAPRLQAVFWILQLVAAAAIGFSASAQELQPPDQVAREAYAAGLDSFARGAYAEAAGIFARADSLAASPNAKLMLGRCLRLLNQLPEAYRTLQDTLRLAATSDPARYQKTAEAARNELEQLRNQLGFLTVYVHTDPGPALLHVDGLPIPPSDWQTPLPVRAGTVYVSLETTPGAIERRSVEIGAGQSESLVIGTLSEPAPSLAPAASLPAAPVAQTQPSAANSADTSLRTAGWVVGGVGVLGLVTFAVLGTLSNSAFEELEESCPIKSRCDPSLQPTAERGEIEQTAANVSLVVGLSALATSAVLFVLSEPSEERPGVSVAAGPAGIRVEGAF